MAVIIGDKTYRTLEDGLVVNGNVVSECLVNGVRCYPDNGHPFVAVCRGSRHYYGHHKHSGNANSYFGPCEKSWTFDVKFTMHIYSDYEIAKSQKTVVYDAETEGSETSGSYSWYNPVTGPHGRHSVWINYSDGVFPTYKAENTDEITGYSIDPIGRDEHYGLEYFVDIEVSMSPFDVCGPTWTWNGLTYGRSKYGFETYNVDNHIRNVLNGHHTIRVEPNNKSFGWAQVYGTPIDFGGDVLRSDFVMFRPNHFGLEVWCNAKDAVVCNTELFYTDDPDEVTSHELSTRREDVRCSYDAPITSVDYIGLTKHMNEKRSS